MISPLTRIARALRMRCPECGCGPFAAGIRPLPSCPACGLKLERGESDHLLGSYTINLSIGLVSAVAMTVLLVWLGGRLPMWALGLIAIAVCEPAIVWFHPWSKVVWLAVDLVFRPATERDFAR